jgi:hypothetical protein
MKILLGAAIAAATVAGAVVAQPVNVIERPPLEDKRIAISTLVREDIFAGIIDRDMVRFARGEANIDKLLEMRPADRPTLLAWKGGALLNRAAIANEAGDKAAYKRYFTQAVAALDEADKAGMTDGGKAAVSGASELLFADRLAPADAKAMWARAYDNYQMLWKAQGGIADKLPPHLRGELMSGMVMTAQRTGRQAEADAALEKMLVIVKDTPYETVAKQWKADPKIQPNSMLSCKNCHDVARLAPIMSTLAPKS